MNNDQLKEYPYIDPDEGIHDADREKFRQSSKRYYEKNSKALIRKTVEYKKKHWRKGAKSEEGL